MADVVPAYLTIGEVARAVGVSIDTLRRWEAAGRVSFDRVGSRRVLPVERLATLAGAHDARRRSSATNTLTATVTAVELDHVMARVELSCGEHRLTSLVTRDACEALGLVVGHRATVVINPSDVVLERWSEVPSAPTPQAVSGNFTPVLAWQR